MARRDRPQGASKPIPEGEESDPLLSVRDLRTTFRTDRGTIRAVDGVSFDVHPRETVGIVGESGSGKTVTARSIVGLVEEPGRVHPESSIRFRGQRVGAGGDRDYEWLRGSRIAMVFQDALSALNPVYTVGDQLEEAFRYQRDLDGDARERAIDLLEAVGIPDAPRRLSEYPHQLSGGQRQRVLVAMALACDPDLLICDEPTTALDVTTQAAILDLLERLQRERDMSLLFITHDMGVIAQIADRVNVMYAGEIVERAPVGELFSAPKHPYTRGLLESVPSARRESDPDAIEGSVPTPTEPASYCRFAPRCPASFEACERTHPEAVAPDSSDDPERRVDDPGRTVSCLLYPETMSREDRLDYHRATRDASEPHAVDSEPGGDTDA